MSKEKNPDAVLLGRLGGAKGGKARMAKLSAEERAALGTKAVQARWSVFRAQAEDGRWFWVCDLCGAVSPGSSDEDGEERGNLIHAEWCSLAVPPRPAKGEGADDAD